MITNKLKILQVALDQLSWSDLEAKISQYLAGSRPCQIVTVNPEFLLEARNNYQFQQVLNQADLALADGFGLQIAALVKGHYLPRHTGADLTTYLLSLATKNGLKVAIINWQHSLSNSTELSEALQKLYPSLHLKIIAAERGEALLDLNNLQSFAPDLVFCSLGAPFQDELLAKILPQLSAKIGIGIGGSLDYLTGQAERAPLVLRKLGLEWLWRFLINPKARATRIFAAVVKFPFYFILDDLIHPFFYRPNVVGFIYQGDEVLIVNSAKETHDFWKLPQGGKETGESEEQAIAREMYEELRLKDYQLKSIYSNAFKYRWPAGYSIHGYKGQRQSLCLIEYQGNKNSITLDHENRAYRWVKIKDLIKEVDPVFEKAYTLFIEKYRQSSKSQIIISRSTPKG